MKPGGVLGRGALELLVIIVGVLIALSVDQWSVRVSERAVEAAYLLALGDDITRSVEDLDSVMSQTAHWLQAAETLSKMTTDSPPPADSLTKLIGEALFALTAYDNRLTTHTELKATGRVGLFSDRAIRRHVSEIDGLLDAIRFQERDLIGAQHSTFDGFLVERTDLAAVAKAGWPAAAQYIGEGSGLDHGDLLTDREFRGVVALRIVILSETLLRYGDLRRHLLELQALIFD